MASPLLNLRVSPSEREAWVRAAGGESLSRWIRRVCNEAATGSPGRSTEVPVPDAAAEGSGVPRRGVPEHRAERVRAADAAVAALQREDPAPVVVPPAEDQDPRYRTGRCSAHPGALPRFNDYSRCAWGCKLLD